MKKPSKPAPRTAAVKTRKKRQPPASHAATAAKPAAKLRSKAAIVAVAASAAPKGCCTIESPDGPDRDIPGLTEAECRAIQNAHPGTVTHWQKGSCA